MRALPRSGGYDPLALIRSTLDITATDAAALDPVRPVRDIVSRRANPT